MVAVSSSDYNQAISSDVETTKPLNIQKKSTENDNKTTYAVDYFSPSNRNT